MLLLLAFGVGTLALESVSLRRVLPPAGGDMKLWTCARVKMASYPLALVNYGLGAAGLSMLLRQRAGIDLPRAAGAVLLISLFDLGILLVVTVVSSALLATQLPALQAGIIAGTVLLMAGGIVFLRAPVTLGPLERLRGLSLFQAVRTVPTRLLFELGVLRLLFVLSFVAVTGAALSAFDVCVPLGDLVVGVAGVALVSALPIAVAGIGPGQIAFVELFKHWSSAETLLACHLTMSLFIVLMRGGAGLALAGEFTREALQATREPSP